MIAQICTEKPFVLMENVLSRNSKQWKKTEDFFPSFENMKINFTYIMFTFSKHATIKKNKTSGVITRKYFLWTTV